MNKTRLFLSIYGFIIEVKLNRSRGEQANKEKGIMERRIVSYYRNFITSKITNRPDFIVNFITKKNFLIFTPKDKKTSFLDFFYTNNKKSLTTYYENSFFQFQLIIKKVLNDLLSQNKGIMLHASASEINGKASVFTGHSGSGKSTVVRLLKSKFPSLADDLVILRKEQNYFYLYQTPFKENKIRISKRGKKFIIGKVFIVKKANSFLTRRITNKNWLIKLLSPQLFVGGKKNVELFIEFVSKYNEFYNLYFPKNAKRLIEFLADTKD